MLHSAIGTYFPLPSQFHYHLPYSPVTNLTELFQLLFWYGAQHSAHPFL